MYIALQPKDPNGQVMLAFEYMQTKNFQSAAQSFKAALHAKPNDPMCLYNLGLAYFNMKDYRQALETDERLLKLQPKAVPPRLMAAYCAERIGDMPTAIKHYQAAAEIPGAQVQALMNMARVYASMGKKNESMAALSKVVKIDKHNYEANLTLGKFQFLQTHQYKEAEASFQAAHAGRPSDPIATALLAMTQSQLGKNAEALTNAKAALKAAPKDRMVLEICANVQQRAMKLDGAMQILRQWQKCYPQDPTPGVRLAGL